MNKATLRDVDVRGKRVLVRVDFNVPLDARGQITDDTRIRAALPTIHYLLEHGASVILMSHLGRPRGRVVESLRLTPVARRLSALLGQPVQLTPDCVGTEVERQAQALQPGQVLLLDNLRFHAQEEANDAAFAQDLARLGDLYANDAFGTAHRAHASTEGVTHFLPSVAGLLMEKELAYLGHALEHPRRPLVAIVGGAKVSDKLAVLDRLLDVADAVLIGGGMANTLLKARGYAVGASLVEDDQLDEARRLMAKAAQQGKPLVLPVDVVVADRVTADAAHQVMAADAVPDGWRILDIGPETVRQFGAVLATAQTIVWNGTLGVAEFPAFATGTEAIIALLVARTQAGATTIIGGGDSAAAVAQAGAAEQVSHVSTGGGAALELLEGRTLPGVAALQERAAVQVAE